MKKKLLTLCLGLFAALAFGGCQVKNNQTQSTVKPNYPPAIEDVVSVSKFSNGTLNLDESGLINKVKGITSVSLYQDVPAGYKNGQSLGGGTIKNMPEKKGTLITAQGNGASFWYSQIVDLKQVQGDLIRFTTPVTDKGNITSVTVSLVDIHDTSRVVSLDWKGKVNSIDDNIFYRYSSLFVNCNGVVVANNNEGEGAAGYAFNAPRPVYGAISYAQTFDGLYLYPDKAEPFHFSYDYEENRVYSTLGFNDGALGDRKDAYMLLDVDDPTNMGSEILTFKGFTTGEIYIKVTMNTVVGEGQMMLTSIGGRDLSLDEQTKTESNFIRMDMNYDYYNGDLPNGVVNEFYPLPTAQDGDVCWGGNKIGVKLTHNGRDLTDQVQADGFTPTETGSYTLRFWSQDVNGYSVFRVFYFMIEDNANPIDIEIGEIVDAKIFSYAVMPQISVQGGNGNTHNTVNYYHNGKKITPDKQNRYYLEEGGKLTVEVVATDYLGAQKTVKAETEIEGTTRISVDNGYFPKTVNAGSKFSLPQFSVLEYDGLEINEKEKEAYVDLGAGYTLCTEDFFTVPESGEVKVKLASKNTTLVEREFIMSVKSLSAQEDVSDRFVAQNVTATQIQQGVSLAFGNGESTTQWSNALSAVNTEISFWFYADRANYDSLTFTFTDSVNEQEKVMVRLLKKEKSLELQSKNENGEYVNTYILLNDITENSHISFFFDSRQNAITNFAGKQYIPFVSYEDGNIFKGFSSKGVFISISAQNVTDNAAITVSRLGNQELAAANIAYGDMVGPQISTKHVIVGDAIYTKGETLLIPAAKAFDVLQSQSTVSVRLTLSGKEIALPNGNSCLEDQTVTLEKNGTYILMYTGTDANDRSYTERYAVIVRDKVPPTVTLQGEYKTTYRLNESVTALNVTVTDDTTSPDDITVKCVVLDTKSKMTFVEIGESYTFTCEGTYGIYYYATDVDGNVAITKVAEIEVY